MKGEDMEKVIVAIKVDRWAMDSLDRIAEARRESTTQVMIGFFQGLRHSVELLHGGHQEDLNILRDKMAKLLLAQAPHATPEAFQFAASIFARAAELKIQQGEDRQ